jgi:hypothetical protein
MSMVSSTFSSLTYGQALMCLPNLQGIAKILAPAMAPLIIRYQPYCRQMLRAGWVICMLALALASFATELWHLVFFQGLLFGIGWLLASKFDERMVCG